MLTHEEAARLLALTPPEAQRLRKVIRGGGWIRNAYEPMANRHRNELEALRARKMVTYTPSDTLYSKAYLTAKGRIALRRWELAAEAARRARREAA